MTICNDSMTVKAKEISRPNGERYRNSPTAAV